MILSKTKEIKFNLGNFEMATVEATIEVDTSQDLLVQGLTSEEIQSFLDGRIDEWIKVDADKLRRINAPLKEGESALEHWGEIDG